MDFDENFSTCKILVINRFRFWHYLDFPVMNLDIDPKFTLNINPDVMIYNLIFKKLWVDSIKFQDIYQKTASK